MSCSIRVGKPCRIRIAAFERDALKNLQSRTTVRAPPLALFLKRSYTFPMPERTQRPVSPAPWGPKEGESGGPKAPDISKPDTRDLLKRMRKVDPNQSKRYRQRTGQ